MYYEILLYWFRKDLIALTLILQCYYIMSKTLSPIVSIFLRL